jgi:phenylalanyl-tRNA synthetase beta subunit
VVDADKDFGPVLEAVKAVNEVRDLEVFDVYQGKNIPEGKKSVAFRIKITGDPAKAGAG